MLFPFCGLDEIRLAFATKSECEMLGKEKGKQSFLLFSTGECTMWVLL